MESKTIDWGDIIGHEKNKDWLQKALKRGVPHCLILSGASGVGKLMIAKKLAKSFFCLNSQAPCEKCRACLDVNNIAESRLKIFGSKVKLGIEIIRQLRSDLQKSDFGGGFRILIVDDIDKIDLPAANALLKLLEEPNQNIFFIFVTSNLNRVIDTIVSRSVVLYFDRLSVEEMNQIVKRDISGFGHQELINLSMGRPKILDNLNSITKDNHIQNVKNFWSIASMSAKGKVAYAKKMAAVEDEKIAGILFFWETCLRDLLLWKISQSRQLIWKDDFLDKYYAKLNISVGDVLKMLKNISILRKYVGNSFSKRIHLVDLLFGFDWRSVQ